MSRSRRIQSALYVQFHGVKDAYDVHISSQVCPFSRLLRRDLGLSIYFGILDAAKSDVWFKLRPLLNVGKAQVGSTHTQFTFRMKEG